MIREDIDHFFMKIAFMYASRSTCFRRQVGSVIARDKIQLSAGYNGALPGMEHCIDNHELCIREKLHIPSGERQELCLTGDNYVRLLDGQLKSMEELAKTNEDVWLYSVDELTGNVVPAQATNPHLTGQRDDIVKIVFENRKAIKCTSDHRIMMQDLSYKQAINLKPNDVCRMFAFNDEFTLIHNKVIAVEKLNGVFPVYDLEVPETNNFAIDMNDRIGLIVHNCRSQHAEANAISKAAMNGINIKDATLYVTCKPCTNCTKMIISSGIKRLVYCGEYSSGIDDELTNSLITNIQVDTLNPDDFEEFIEFNNCIRNRRC